MPPRLGGGSTHMIVVLFVLAVRVMRRLVVRVWERHLPGHSILIDVTEVLVFEAHWQSVDDEREERWICKGVRTYGSSTASVGALPAWPR